VLGNDGSKKYALYILFILVAYVMIHLIDSERHCQF